MERPPCRKCRIKFQPILIKCNFLMFHFLAIHFFLSSYSFLMHQWVDKGEWQIINWYELLQQITAIHYCMQILVKTSIQIQTHKIHISNIWILSACHIHVDPYQCPPKLTLYKSLPKKIIYSSVPYCTYNVHDAFSGEQTINRTNLHLGDFALESWDGIIL